MKLFTEDQIEAIAGALGGTESGLSAGAKLPRLVKLNKRQDGLPRHQKSPYRSVRNCGRAVMIRLMSTFGFMAKKPQWPG